MRHSVHSQASDSQVLTADALDAALHLAHSFGVPDHSVASMSNKRLCDPSLDNAYGVSRIPLCGQYRIKACEDKTSWTKAAAMGTKNLTVV